jgi:outer membrane protein assembly factor BamC
MMNTRISKRAGLAVSLGALVLTGCSAVNQLTGAEEPVNYKSTVRGEPLSIPPDLTQANQDTRFQAPEGPTTYSQYASSQQSRQNADNRDAVLPQSQGVEVMRDGDLRWLVVDRAPDDVYPRVIEFWGQQGFTIHSQDPKAGLIQTDWAENRAKIPEGWIHSALGAILDTVYDSGERERFRTRLERVNGKTEVYISHEHMEETQTRDGSGWKWIYGKEDPGLNAAMLARLMVYLGTDVEQAQQKVAQAEQPQAEVQVQQQMQEGQSALSLNEGFDRAWRRVGVAIDSAGFEVTDRDRSTGDYFVRYLDSDSGEKIEQQNVFGRLFGTKNTAEAATYRIHVVDQGGSSVVTVLDANGQPQDTDTAKRILGVLSKHIK